jgi:hypothetical protein
MVDQKLIGFNCRVVDFDFVFVLTSTSQHNTGVTRIIPSTSIR